MKITGVKIVNYDLSNPGIKSDAEVESNHIDLLKKSYVTFVRNILTRIF